MNKHTIPLVISFSFLQWRTIILISIISTFCMIAAAQPSCLDLDRDNICDNVDPCLDVDGDGYGSGPDCLGIDCLDSDPSVPDQDTDCNGKADYLTNACNCRNGSTFIVIRETEKGCEEFEFKCFGGITLSDEYKCGRCYLEPCSDDDPCTVYDEYDENGVCKGILKDRDRDTIGDRCDKCPGYDDRRDYDGDGIPDGCDPDPSCTECTPDEDGFIYLCWASPRGRDFTFKAQCEDLLTFFDKEGKIKRRNMSCGPCKR